MKSRDILIKLKNGAAIKIEQGMPPFAFYPVAWGDEPLTSQALIGTDIMYSLPSGDETRSFVAKDDAGTVIGQCSTNDVVTYWDHLNTRKMAEQNSATKSFIEIHQLAVKAELEYAQKNGLEAADCAHNAGIAVLPKVRRQKVATHLTKQQIQSCKEANKQALFVETTNHKSADIMQSFSFYKVASYPYKDLAKEIGNAGLNKLEGDSFSVWCKKL